jgi:hypothetical protein
MSELIDITDLIIPEETNIFNEDESLELYNTCIYLMEELITEYPTLISEPDFEDIFDESIEELMYSHFDDDIFYNDDAEEELDYII